MSRRVIESLAKQLDIHHINGIPLSIESKLSVISLAIGFTLPHQYVPSLFYSIESQFDKIHFSFC